MAAIVNTALAAATVTYGTVQFGGSDAAQKSLPPMYAFRGVHRWDDSGRAIMGVDYTLSVRCIFFEVTEAAMAANMRAIRSVLATPGLRLRIMGMGTGFGVIDLPNAVPPGTVFDIGNGPHPGPIECVPIGGHLAWELSWSVSFFVSECATASTSQLAFLAFNFNTTWRNDFEGLTQRVISGHVLIPQYRNPNAPKTVLHVAEETRGAIVVSVPPGFARIENTWRESDDKGRLDFTIVDEQLEGDNLPVGITAGDGSFSFSAGDGSIAGSGMASGMATLSMSLKTATNQHKTLAGNLFIIAALTKQVEMMQGMAAAKIAAAAETPTRTIPDGSAIPVSIRISNGKFARSRQTDCQMTWILTQELNAILAASGIWTPVHTLLSNSGFSLGAQDYTQWRASMAALWNNRGTSGITSNAGEAVIIDLCDNVSNKTIGVSGSTPSTLTTSSLPSLACPTMPAGGGWIHWDLDIQVHRSDQQTTHRKAAFYLPSVGQLISQADPGSGLKVSLGGPEYSQPASDHHTTENHGYPEIQIGLSFAALRFGNKPYMPEIRSVAGLNVRHVRSQGGEAKIVFDSFGCPIWATSGYRVYSVPGYVGQILAIGSKVSAAAPPPAELVL